MKTNKINYKNIFSYFLMISFLLPCTFANIGFFGSEINSEKINQGDELIINSNLVNREDLVKARITVAYELRRINDMSLLKSKSDEFSFAPNEVKKLNETIETVGVPSGDYFLNVNVLSGSGTPLSFITHKITIDGDGDKINFKELPYLKIYYPYDNGRVRYELSYSNTGKPIIPDENFEVRFSLENLEPVSKNLRMEFHLKNSYSVGNLEKIYSEEITVGANKIEEFITDYKMNKAGTYDLFVKIFDENEMLIANKEVRVVIMGAGGSLIDVFNKQDTYLVGETTSINVGLVGPADAVSVVSNVYLKTSILKEDRVISEKKINIERLPFNPLEYDFEFDVIENLEYYKVKVVLGKGDKIYDEVILDYEPLKPEFVISSDGRIYDPTVIACFDDGICSNQETELGRCVDCIALKIKKNVEVEEENLNESNQMFTPVEDNNSGMNKYLIIGIFNLVIVLILAVIVIRRKK